MPRSHRRGPARGVSEFPRPLIEALFDFVREARCIYGSSLAIWLTAGIDAYPAPRLCIAADRLSRLGLFPAFRLPRSPVVLGGVLRLRSSLYKADPHPRPGPKRLTSGSTQREQFNRGIASQSHEAPQQTAGFGDSTMYSDPSRGGWAPEEQQSGFASAQSINLRTHRDADLIWVVVRLSVPREFSSSSPLAARRGNRNNTGHRSYTNSPMHTCASFLYLSPFPLLSAVNSFTFSCSLSSIRPFLFFLPMVLPLVGYFFLSF